MSHDKHAEFGGHIEWYVKHVGSLLRMLPPFAHASGRMTTRIESDLEKLIEDHGIDKQFSSEGELEAYALVEEYSGRHRTLLRALHDSGIFMTLLPRMALVTLVSIYDAYLGRLVRSMLKARPEILNASNRQLTFAQITEFADISEAREHLLESEVDSLLRDSHPAQFDWLESKLSMPLRKNLDVWAHFIEVTERRNIFVHCDGIVGKQYQSICLKAGLEEPSIPAIGEQLSVPPEYFRKACYAMLEIGVMLGQTLWRKLSPSEHDMADVSLIDTTYDLLATKDYAIAEKLSRFGALPPIKAASAGNALYLKFNLAVAVKGQKRDDEVKSLLSDIDLSALSHKFQLAAAVLREEWDVAGDLMKRIGKDGELSKADYRDWPLFQWFRKTQQFKDTYRDLYGESFRHIRSREHGDESTSSESAQTEVEGDAEVRETEHAARPRNEDAVH